MSSFEERAKAAQEVEQTVRLILQMQKRDDLVPLLEKEWWEREMPTNEDLKSLGFDYHPMGRFGDIYDSRESSEKPKRRMGVKADFDRKFSVDAVREVFQRSFSFAIPSREILDFIVKTSPSIIEVGSGTGFWAHLLRKRGADVIASDWFASGEHIQEEARFCEILPMSGEDAVSAYPDRDLLVIWPYGSGEWLTEAARRLKPGRKLIFIGEGSETCGSESFHELIRDERFFKLLDVVHIVRFSWLHDHLTVLEKVC
jgi:SAM-dependent methyltransferase